MEKHPVITQIEKADKAIVAEDFETLLNILRMMQYWLLSQEEMP